MLSKIMHIFLTDINKSLRNTFCTDALWLVSGRNAKTIRVIISTNPITPKNKNSFMDFSHTYKFYLKKSILIAISKIENPKTLSSHKEDNPVANLAPNQPPIRNPIARNMAIFVST